jgi:putative SOS response-associated peptidase YedK
MAKRAAYFASREEVETFFNLNVKRENIFEPNYNISPGQHVPAVFYRDENISIDRLRWGSESGDDWLVSSEEVEELLKNRDIERCVIPLSGFYIWKDDKEKESPFFVRMLSSPLMAAAAIYHQAEGYFRLITAEANVLVKPMSNTMPLLLDRESAFKWLNREEQSLAEFLEEAGKLFLLTDLSVLRVSKKVNDPKNNNAKLVQPIPK